jgi:UDP-N-acetylmuramoyl-tripeptide--D-alanyl-D-alanine ligase
MSKTPLWTVAEVARALRLSGDFPDTAIDFVTQDSRLVKPGSLFVALSGTPSGGFISSFASARNGWEFAASAEAAGAAAMIVPHRIDSVSVPQLVVPDTLLDGLWALAHAARLRFKGEVIGLTGSAGKTSTKADALQRRPEGDRLGGRDRHEPGRRNRAARSPCATDRGVAGECAAGASGETRQS